jgi:lipoprotein-anchoring transpeptidase ErfK/SrfK
MNRRDILKLAALSLGSLGLRPFKKLFALPEFPDSDRLGRICYGRWDLKSQPHAESSTTGMVMDDAVLPWLRETPGLWSIYRNNQRWVDTGQGYIWGAYFQPVRNIRNQPVETIPQTSIGAGMWAEVTVPYVDALLINPPPRHPWFLDLYTNRLPLRFYYSQILWVDQIKKEADGSVFYRVNEKYGNRGDLYWADAQAFRPLSPEEMEPINPQAENKRIVIEIDRNRQSLSCYEGNTEVYYCRASTGKAEGSTPIGQYAVYRKLVSLHMEGGSAVAGWDVNGVGWTCLFTGGGVAIHSTYWHNNFGEPESNGCVNVTPDDSKWIFRWASPQVQFIPGDQTVTDFSGTSVIVKQA